MFGKIDSRYTFLRCFQKNFWKYKIFIFTGVEGRQVWGWKSFCNGWKFSNEICSFSAGNYPLCYDEWSACKWLLWYFLLIQSLICMNIKLSTDFYKFPVSRYFLYCFLLGSSLRQFYCICRQIQSCRKGNPDELNILSKTLYKFIWCCFMIRSLNLSKTWYIFIWLLFYANLFGVGFVHNSLNFEWKSL